MQIKLQLSDCRDIHLFKSDIPDGVSVDTPMIHSKNDALGEITFSNILITVATGIPISLVSKWLYEKFANSNSSKITINRREINMRDGDITSIIEEIIKMI